MSRFSPAPDWTAVPARMKEERQWVVWKYEQHEGEPKARKVPKRVDGRGNAKSDDPSTWGTFEEAMEKIRSDPERKLQAGFMLTPPFVGFDYDNGCDEDGYPSPEGVTIYKTFNTYTEISPSGRGFKGIALGNIPDELIGTRTGVKVTLENGIGYEIYRRGRFFAITARHIPGTPTECTEANGAIPWFIQTYILPNRKERALPAATGTIKEVRTSCPEKEHPPIEQRIRRAKKYLEKCAPAILGQNGSIDTFVVAMKVARGFCLSIEESLVALEDWNQRCEPPWNEKDLIHKLEGALEDSGMEWHHFLKAPPPAPEERPLREPPEEGQVVDGQVIAVDDQPLWLTPSQALLRAKDISHRFLTRVPTLDRITGGGIPRGRVLLMAGAPGAGKTTLAIQIACDMAVKGAVAGLLLADEGLTAGVVRMAQRIGFEREKLEAADPDTIQRASTKLRKIDERILCIDPDHPQCTMDNFIAGMDRLAGDLPQVWLIDSAQTVFRKSGSELRTQIKDIADRIKAEARRRAAVVIFLSQTNRAAYRSKKDEDNSNPLSAAAESGAIEHMADVMIFFSPNGENRAKVVVPKNRLGSGPLLIPFHLALDRVTATYSEVDENVDETGKMLDDQTKKLKILRAKGEKILKELKLNPEGLTGRQIGEAVGGKHEYNREALELLRADGKVFSEPIPKGGMLWKAVR